jgi:uncharacterized protein (DUF1684 family)
MQKKSFRLLAIFLLLPSLSNCFLAQEAGQWKQEERTWRTQRASSLLAPDGWFSLVGLDWLQPGETTVGAAPDNRIRLKGDSAPHVGIPNFDGKQVRLLAPAGGFPSRLTVGGLPAKAGALSEDAPLRIGTFTLVAIQRGDRFALRIKDSQAQTRLGFHGLRWYPAEERYRVLAKWIPYTPPHDVEIPTVLGTKVQDKVPGVAEFTVDSQVVRLEPIVEEKELFFILRDTTSRTDTYGAGRFLYAALPSHGLNQPGELWLDFNRLQNPPCAYTPYATCPLPPAQNRLSVAIPAGEKRYHAE